MTSPATPPSANIPKKAAAPIVLGQVPDASSGANISVICPSCQWQTKVSLALLGKKIRCKQCSGIIQISAPEQAATPEATVVVTEPIAPALPVAPLTPPSAPAPVAAPPAPPAPPIPGQIAEPLITPPLRTEPVQPTIPIANWTAPEATLDSPLSSSRISPGTTVLVAEISNLKSRLEAATRDSSLYVKRAEEAEAKLQYAEQRIHEAERTLHELAGKATIDTMTANRKIADLEARLAPLDANLAALNQSLAAVTTGVSFELEQAEKTVSRLKAILASRDAPRTR